MSTRDLFFWYRDVLWIIHVPDTCLWGGGRMGHILCLGIVREGQDRSRLGLRVGNTSILNLKYRKYLDHYLVKDHSGFINSKIPTDLLASLFWALQLLCPGSTPQDFSPEVLPNFLMCSPCSWSLQGPSTCQQGSPSKAHCFSSSLCLKTLWLLIVFMILWTLAQTGFYWPFRLYLLTPFTPFHRHPHSSRRKVPKFPT